ncbi:protein adenylyltransferase SelO [Cellvibrio japonicus]|uniref:Protein nucleotidyltransferase YdiU n=1 Tax=Cellvibrio japonicus (strain Ueda107) TaxID=498211 RepID=B3PLJ3_CELJU|nr:YdiU family protein [Cellvibrio japonicus]ACE85759.1 conserved hypothetical protein [Cellvibrio japonicus Ueda107]QEI12979.1 YdiU family protein [Cellvibrio japonicus]QEI16553.1 YdiU family protein [Cellvibrio japonicus]QEI20131.1 YdiU family protein [Cellvibrio japonicus]
MTLRSLAHLRFDNRLVRELPADPVVENYRRQVTGAVYSRVTPTPVSAPQLIMAAQDVADLLDLGADILAQPEFTQVFAGNSLLPGMEPHACCYGGHQFGNWAGQLGDGRAINLGEVINQRGEHWTLQLKGAGPTPYSRTADGLAVLRSSLREFLCSEAMHHLGVPTTRALSLVTTGELVRRDMFYDGNPQWEPGAIVCRVAPGFTRFGNFEIFSARGDIDLLRQLVDFTIRADFPALLEGNTPDKHTYLRWYQDVCKRTAQLMAHWMRVGFVHGVMNTDNMSILGLTIDYGPYGWLEGYDPDWTPNTTDAQGRRYRYGNQPRVALWNLAQLANAIYPLINEVEPLQAGLEYFRAQYEACSQQDMAAKLGLSQFRQETDQPLVESLLAVLQSTEMDMTIFYRRLASIASVDLLDASNEYLLTHFLPACYQTPDATQVAMLRQWLMDYARRIQQDVVMNGWTEVQRCALMNRTNPKYVLRNYMAQQAIDKATQGDYNEVQQLLTLLRNPYDEQPEFDRYFAKRPEWARHKAGCSMLSCSS